MIVGVGAALVLLWAINRPASLVRVATPTALSAKFERVVFGRDSGPDRETVTKWGASIGIVIATPLPDYLRQTLQDTLSELKRLSGLNIGLARGADDGTIEIHYARHADFASIVRRFDPFRTKSLSWLRSVNCFFSGILNNHKFERAVIGIADDLGEQGAKSCVLEELYQGLGPGKDSMALLPSISSSQGTQTALSINDKIILRALYDERITPGMPRARAMAIAREVIAELVAAVKARGEAALTHPRYRPGR
ncbi:MAG: DUF2927 domain-containing protein [Alphaproteobacteria bacterium]|nr:DUF2927 domain-containing protein [Alphaproteobacteria bacterium]